MDSNRRLRSITENLDDYDEKYMKMNFDLDDELPFKWNGWNSYSDDSF